MRGNLERSRTELLLSHPSYYNIPNVKKKTNQKAQCMYLGQLLPLFCRKVMPMSTSKQCHNPEVIKRYAILWFASLVTDIISQLSQLFNRQQNQFVLVYYSFQFHHSSKYWLLPKSKLC